jgi:hypothetical protein
MITSSPRKRSIGFPRSAAVLIKIGDHRGASVKPDTIDKQILHHALDIVARFGERNPLYPIDGVYI